MTALALCERTHFREQLLYSTAQYALEHIPAYREPGYSNLLGVRTLSDLTQVPILRKDSILSEPAKYRNPHQRPALIQHTSGTSGEPLFIHRSREELDFIQCFFGAVSSPEVASGTSIVISLSGTSNPVETTPTPLQHPVLKVNLRDPAWRTTIVETISEPWRMIGLGETPCAVVGLESDLRILTSLLLQKRFDFRRSRVHSLITSGDLITRRLKRFYETTWKARLFDHYGLSEIFGSCSLCGVCGSFHPDPHVILEVLDIDTLRPVTGGHGVATFTTLYPFVQMQPFIRYWSGDLVEVVNNECPIDPTSFTLHGRLSKCIVVPEVSRSRAIISAVEAYDALDEFPEIASSSMFRWLEEIKDHSQLGHLKFEMQATVLDGLKVELEFLIETRFQPEMYCEASIRLGEQVGWALRHRSPELDKQISLGVVKLLVKPVAPGTLGSFMPDMVE